MPSLSTVQQLAARNGLNLCGLVDANRLDSALPPEHRVAAELEGCESILVLGTAGRSLDLEFQRQVGASLTRLGERATEALVEGSVGLVADALRALQVRFRRVPLGGGRLPRNRLGEAAGFGVVSPVSGLLLHPEYGPWLRVRAAILLEGTPLGEPVDLDRGFGFQPCARCSQPCVVACPPRALDGVGSCDSARCAAHRRGGGCRVGCDSRIACPVGAEHADRPSAPMRARGPDQVALARGDAGGWWRLLPRTLRRGVCAP